MTRTPRLWTFRTSPFAGKARIAFAEKGVEVELVEVHPVRRPARLTELNPLGKVPVLELEGIAIRESSLICEWLEETHPEPPLWPADAAERGRARGWAKYVDDAISANFFRGMSKLSFGKAPDDPEDIAERMHAKVTRSWPLLEAALAERPGPWLAGAGFSLADVSAMPAAVRLPEWAPQLAPEAADLPLVAAWLEALRARPSASAVDASGERAVEG